MTCKLLSYTNDCEKLVAGAARLCYSSHSIDNLFDNLTDYQKFIDRLLKMGHESPLEHCSFTFGIEGVSRALLAQITRHRIASYSVKSQRYVNEGDMQYVTPERIADIPEANAIFTDTMEYLRGQYEKIRCILYERLLEDGGKPNDAEKEAIEDARFVLPNACETKMIVTMNARSLHNFFRLRCCQRAQWEIRELANLMLELVRDVAPAIFKYGGPPCANGKCPEGEKSCGKIRAVR